MKDDELINRLKDDLAPAPVVAPMSRVFWAWLIVSVGYVVLLCGVLGPFRPGFADQLLSVPRFSLEMLLGIGALICFALVALGESIPGIDVRWFRRIGWILGVGWVSQFPLALGWPAIEPSMLGKRDHCIWEAYLYSVPPLVAMVWLQRNRFALRPIRAIGYAALAAGLLPALIMQIACMYDPVHILQFHVSPIAVLTVAAVGVGWVMAGRRV